MSGGQSFDGQGNSQYVRIFSLVALFILLIACINFMNLSGASVLSVIVSCLGLFGLDTFATQKRVKEIGVRKVLGASEAGIVALLSKDFIVLSIAY